MFSQFLSFKHKPKQICCRKLLIQETSQQGFTIFESYPMIFAIFHVFDTSNEKFTY